jgi:Tfp pilus assembly protein PilX
MTDTPLKNRPLNRRPFRRRTGMILAVVLVALLVVMMFGAALTNTFLAQRQLSRNNRQQQQAFWLAESALQRAVSRLAREADYEGETWQVAAESLDGKHAGVAIIRIEAASEPNTGSKIVVDASYPSRGLKRIAQRCERFVPNDK